MSEHGDGQLELTMEPSWGVKAADDAFIYKQCAKETAIDHGIMATFMCNPWLQVQNGGHYNFSAWKDGVSVFTDNSDPDGLSEIGKNWVAGLMEHAPALTALVCHTNNCYSRFFEGGFAPYHICYAVENRSAMVRIKRAESSGTHLEFRLPGAAANPYIVVLATVAAGLDGLRRKLKVFLYSTRKCFSSIYVIASFLIAYNSKFSKKILTMKTTYKIKCNLLDGQR